MALFAELPATAILGVRQLQSNLREWRVKACDDRLQACSGRCGRWPEQWNLRHIELGRDRGRSFSRPQSRTPRSRSSLRPRTHTYYATLACTHGAHLLTVARDIHGRLLRLSCSVDQVCATLNLRSTSDATPPRHVKTASLAEISFTYAPSPRLAGLHACLNDSENACNATAGFIRAHLAQVRPQEAGRANIKLQLCRSH